MIDQLADPLAIPQIAAPANQIQIAKAVWPWDQLNARNVPEDWLTMSPDVIGTVALLVAQTPTGPQLVNFNELGSTVVTGEPNTPLTSFNVINDGVSRHFTVDFINNQVIQQGVGAVNGFNPVPSGTRSIRMRIAGESTGIYLAYNMLSRFQLTQTINGFVSKVIDSLSQSLPTTSILEVPWSADEQSWDLIVTAPNTIPEANIYFALEVSPEPVTDFYDSISINSPITAYGPDSSDYRVILPKQAYTLDQYLLLPSRRTQRGFYLQVRVDAIGTGNLIPYVYINDPAGFARDLPIWQAATPITAVGDYLYLLYPGATKPTTSSITEVASIPAGGDTSTLALGMYKYDNSQWTFGAEYIGCA